MSKLKAKNTSSMGYKIFRFFNIIFMLLIILVTAYPVYYVVVASFSDSQALSTHIGLLWIPLEPFTTDAYKLVFANRQIFTGFFNTMYVMFFGLTLNLTLTTLGAFFLTIKGPALKNVVTYMIIFTMYFSGGMIPNYLNMKQLGLLDNLWSIILSGGIATTNLIILKTAFQSVPYSLIESARLDGASYLQVLLKVILPLSKAAMAVMILYYGVDRWNGWFNASIYLRDSKLFPLQLVMQNILKSTTQMAAGNAAMDEIAQLAELIKYALIVVTTTPILMIYPFLQKYFVKGVMIGAVKE